MKDYDNSLITILNSDEAIICFLLSIEINDSLTLYYTNLDIPLLWETNLYEPIDMKLDTFNYSASLAVDYINIKIATVDLVIPALVMNNEIRSNTVIVNVGGYDGTQVIAEPQFRGIISEWEMDETELNLTISNELILWNKKALRKPDALCQWGFKETECGYSGTETFCNHTYDQCTAYGNTDNYGGFRFIPAIEENDIWWGTKQG